MLDAAAITVDVYLDGELLLDDLGYASGKDFFPVPVGEALLLEIKGADRRHR